MTEYEVKWSINVAAEDPYNAALEAQSIQFEQVNGITQKGVFTVSNTQTGQNIIIDLDEPKPKSSEAFKCLSYLFLIVI